jgi:hypothetical protein
LQFKYSRLLTTFHCAQNCRQTPFFNDTKNSTITIGPDFFHFISLFAYEKKVSLMPMSLFYHVAQSQSTIHDPLTKIDIYHEKNSIYDDFLFMCFFIVWL